jgi:phospholipid/cholesterol/gamma-HCH transport system substrate-binding protein
VEVEELLGALSLVLNGGGLSQLQTINHEVGIALEGREDGIKNTLDQLDTFIGGLDEQKEELNRALDSVNALAETLAARTATIETALDTIGPGLDVINEQRDLLVDMLEGLARLGDVGTRIINQSAENTIADLRDLQPILTQLAAAGPDLARSLPLLLTYPFPDSSLSALNYRDAQTGGYALFTNMTATIDLDLSNLLCRYAIDPVTGGIEELEPEDVAGDECGVSGSSPGSTQGGADTSSQDSTGLGTLPGDIAGDVVDGATEGDAGLPGLPQLPGGQG